MSSIFYKNKYQRLEAHIKRLEQQVEDGKKHVTRLAKERDDWRRQANKWQALAEGLQKRGTP